MDISNIMIIKNRTSDIKNKQLPGGIKSQLLASGLWICSLYENVTSAGKTPSHDRNFGFYVLVHLLDGTGFYWNSTLEKEQLLQRGQAIMVTPGTLVDYGGCNDKFVEDSIGFMGPAADALLRAGIISEGIIQFGKARRLLPIMEKARNSSQQDLLEANVMLQALLFDLYHENRRKDKQATRYPQLGRLRKEMQRDLNRWWTVSNMADFCNISETHLRRIFREDTGMSPKHYIDHIKIHQAADLLCNTADTIADVALRLGFADPYHFNRRFKQIMGLPPGLYRKQYGFADTINSVTPKTTPPPTKTEIMTSNPAPAGQLK